MQRPLDKSWCVSEVERKPWWLELSEQREWEGIKPDSQYQTRSGSSPVGHGKDFGFYIEKGSKPLTIKCMCAHVYVQIHLSISIYLPS